MSGFQRYLIIFLATSPGVLLVPFSCGILVWIYKWCMVPDVVPGFYSRKLNMMFRMPDPGAGTVLGLAGVLAGGLLIVLPFVRSLRRQ